MIAHCATLVRSMQLDEAKKIVAEIQSGSTDDVIFEFYNVPDITWIHGMFRAEQLEAICMVIKERIKPGKSSSALQPLPPPPDTGGLTKKGI